MDQFGNTLQMHFSTGSSFEPIVPGQHTNMLGICSGNHKYIYIYISHSYSGTASQTVYIKKKCGKPESQETIRAQNFKKTKSKDWYPLASILTGYIF